MLVLDASAQNGRVEHSELTCCPSLITLPAQTRRRCYRYAASLGETVERSQCHPSATKAPPLQVQSRGYKSKSTCWDPRLWHSRAEQYGLIRCTHRHPQRSFPLSVR